MTKKGMVSLQEQKIEQMKLNLQNEIEYLTDMKSDLDLLITEKKNGGRMQKAVIQRKKRSAQDSFKDQLDDFKNQRGEGICQYVNHRNTRCTKQACEEYSDGKEYCKACFGKVLEEGYKSRKSFR